MDIFSFSDLQSEIDITHQSEMKTRTGTVQVDRCRSIDTITDSCISVFEDHSVFEEVCTVLFGAFLVPQDRTMIWSGSRQRCNSERQTSVNRRCLERRCVDRIAFRRLGAMRRSSDSSRRAQSGENSFDIKLLLSGVL